MDIFQMNRRSSSYPKDGFGLRLKILLLTVSLYDEVKTGIYVQNQAGFGRSSLSWKKSL